MHYALWHMGSNNLIVTFDTERDALLFLKEAVLEQGDSVVEDLQLIEEYAEDEDDDAEDDEWRTVGAALGLRTLPGLPGD